MNSQFEKPVMPIVASRSEATLTEQINHDQEIVFWKLFEEATKSQFDRLDFLIKNNNDNEEEILAQLKNQQLLHFIDYLKSQTISSQHNYPQYPLKKPQDTSRMLQQKTLQRNYNFIKQYDKFIDKINQASNLQEIQNIKQQASNKLIEEKEKIILSIAEFKEIFDKATQKLRRIPTIYNSKGKNLKDKISEIKSVKYLKFSEYLKKMDKKIPATLVPFIKKYILNIKEFDSITKLLNSDVSFDKIYPKVEAYLASFKRVSNIK